MRVHAFFLSSAVWIPIYAVTLTDIYWKGDSSRVSLKRVTCVRDVRAYVCFWCSASARLSSSSYRLHCKMYLKDALPTMSSSNGFEEWIPPYALATLQRRKKAILNAHLGVMVLWILMKKNMTKNSRWKLIYARCACTRLFWSASCATVRFLISSYQWFLWVI